MRLLGAGDNVVDRYIGQRTMYPGGNAVNVAVFASRLGADAGYLGVLGDDEAGQLVLKSLIGEGVQTSLTRVASGPNAYAEVSLVDSDRVFVGSDRGVAEFEPTPADYSAMSTFDVVHTAYSGSLVGHVAEMARKTRVSFDFGGRYTLESARPLLGHLFLATFSASEMSAEDAQTLVAGAVAAGAHYALATRGAEGAYLASAAGTSFQEADRVIVRDTLGAGDAFIASMLVGLLSHRGIEKTLAAASAHAAQVCLDHGAFGRGVPFKDAMSSTISMKAGSE